MTRPTTAGWSRGWSPPTRTSRSTGSRSSRSSRRSGRTWRPSPRRQTPGVLELSNVTHLATDVTADLHDHAHVLDLLAALHPTAAVGGTPREAALTAIAELEGMHRGRYTGPTGWVDAAGDGEWGIALRCAQLDGRSARLFAGCGIVAGSDADAEVLEAQAKFVPVRDALEGS